MMLSNYLKIAYRNLLKSKVFSLINLVGLSIGMACSILIFLWIQDELLFNRFHQNSDQLYKVMQNRKNEGGSIATGGNTPYILGDVLTEEYPAILQSVKITDEEDLSISADDVSLKAHSIFATPNLFEVFSFPFVSGDSATALDELYSIVISQRLSHTLFGKENSIGKTININAGELIPFTVTGVFKNVPAHSTLQFDLVAPMQVVLPFWYNYTSWGNNFLTTYVLLDKQADLATVTRQIAPIIKEKGDIDNELFLLSLADTYRYTQFENGKPVGGRIDHIRLFTIIAILMVVIACINFINLTTARATQRAREVGVRKVAGASKIALVRQFLSESTVMVMVALVLAVIFVALILPAFNQLTDKQITLTYFTPTFLLLLTGIGLFTGLLAGIYPAYFLSSFHTIQVLKGYVTHRSGSAGLRRSLIVFQFVMATILITGAMVVYFQMEYIRHKNLGLDKENIIYCEMDMGTKLEAYRNDLLQEPSIKYFTAANTSFRNGFGSTSDFRWKGKPEDQAVYINQIIVDYDFIETMGITIKEGRSFSRAYADTIAFIPNEEAVKVMGFKNPIGETISIGNSTGKIVGVAKNFHFASLHETIEPLMIQLDPRKPGVIYIKSQAGETQEALSALKKVHAKYSSFPLAYHFLDDTLEAMYQSDTLVSKLSGIFASMAILISCLGLLGLVIFTTEQRTKEIGIRKVLGASVTHLLLLLSKDYFKLIILAFIIAIPIANFFITNWLNNFAYRIQLHWWQFMLAGVLVLGIALLSVGRQTVKAAQKNPVDSLRYE